MEWTREKPTDSGWYWWRGRAPDRSGILMVYVEGPSNYLEMRVFSPLMQAKLYGIDVDADAEWYGPLTPPE